MGRRSIPAGALVIEGPRHETVTVRGAEFVMVMNPPLSLLGEIDAGGPRTIAAVRQLVVSHPIVHADGRPADIGDVRDLELLADILKAWRVASTGLPPT